MKKLIYLSFVLFICACSTPTTEQTDSQKTTTENKVAEVNNSKTILFYGNSLTAGLGVGLENAFPAIIEKKLDSLGMDYSIVNAGLSGETTAGGLSRLDWVLNQKVDVFVLELGANDGLRGIPLSDTRANLQAMIDLVKQKNPDTKIVLAGMQIPPNMGQDYASEFKSIWKAMASKNDIPLIPFLLDGVGGIPEMNQADGIHPTKEGHKILAENVWAVLKEVI